MDLLETILRGAGAIKHIETFRQQHVDVNVLALLSDRDLQLLGIDNSQLRHELLKRFSNLLIPTEKPLDTEVTTRYAEEVLSQTINQLNVHHSNLVCALSDNVDVCDIKFEKAIHCLKSCINLLDDQLDKFETKIESKRYYKRRMNAAMSLIFVGGLSLVAYFVVKYKYKLN